MQPQPKQRDADRSRVAILDAAETLFAARGFEAVTMAEIGAAAGVSRGTPGYFFGSKDALYALVVERAAATLTMLAQTLRVRDAAGARDQDAVLAQTVESLLSLLLSRRSIVALLDQSAGGLDSQPHAEAVRDALDGLGTDAERAALTVLAMCWFPLSHPAAARALGIDTAAPDFAVLWREQVIAAVGVPPAVVASAQTSDGPSPKKKKKKKKKD